MTIEPYPFIRVITFTMATFWSLRSYWDMGRSIDRWERRLEPFGIRRKWLRIQFLRAALRATVLDPLNLALILVLVSVWVA
jgi:hypothetical protein